MHYFLIFVTIPISVLYSILAFILQFSENQHSAIAAVATFICAIVSWKVGKNIQEQTDQSSVNQMRKQTMDQLFKFHEKYIVISNEYSLVRLQLSTSYYITKEYFEDLNTEKFKKQSDKYKVASFEKFYKHRSEYLEIRTQFLSLINKQINLCLEERNYLKENLYLHKDFVKTTHYSEIHSQQKEIIENWWEISVRDIEEHFALLDKHFSDNKINNNISLKENFNKSTLKEELCPKRAGPRRVVSNDSSTERKDDFSLIKTARGLTTILTENNKECCFDPFWLDENIIEDILKAA